MIDRIFAPVLTFIMLIAGTAVLVASLFTGTPARELRVAQGMSHDVIVLEPVIVTGKREPAPVAVESRVPASQSVATGADARGLLLRRARD
jgi:hypothetical protein